MLSYLYTRKHTKSCNSSQVLVVIKFMVKSEEKQIIIFLKIIQSCTFILYIPYFTLVLISAIQPCCIKSREFKIANVELNYSTI